MKKHGDGTRVKNEAFLDPGFRVWHCQLPRGGIEIVQGG